jgi:hypothetical protein
MTPTEKLPIVVIACQVFRGLLEQYMPEDLAEQVTFLDYGLHAVPRKLNTTVQDTIDSIEQPSLVVLGYGLCGNGLNNVQAGKHTLVIPRADDCISILLGSREAYLEQFNAQPGTYYLTKGWLESGSDPLKEYRRYREEYGQDTAEYLMDTQYQHYKRLVLVAHTQEDLDTYRPQAQEVARFCERWGYDYEELLGSDSYVRRLVEVAAALDRAEDDFIVVPPGGVLKQAQFMDW